MAGKQNRSFVGTIHEAELFVGQMCLAYLSFSDFETQIEVRTPDMRFERPPDVLQSGPMLWIPNLIGIRSSLFDLPYRLLRGYSSKSAPNIDYSKYLNLAPTAKDTAAPQELLEKYHLLEYIIEHWMYYTRHFEEGSSKLYQKLQDIAKYMTLAFEFRPWGSNQHHGPYGCTSCAPVDASKLAAERLPFMSLFHYAAKVGHWPLMEPLVDEYCSHESGDDETLLIACRNGQQSIVERLTQKHHFDISDGKAISAAVISGNEKIVTYLLDAKATSYGPFSVYRNEHIPLSLASANGHQAIVEILCQRGASIIEGIDRSGRYTLLESATNGHDDLVSYLIASGARVHRKSLGALTPLHCAAENGHDIIVRTLLHVAQLQDPQGSLFNVDLDGDTPLHKAARNGHRAVVEVLLDFNPTMGAWIFRKTRVLLPSGEQERQLAIHLAASNGHVGVLEILSSHVSIDSTTSHGRTPLHIAVAEGHVPAIHWLVRNGASIFLEDKNGYTAMEVAVIGDREEVVKKLIALGQRVTPRLLILAAKKKQEGVLATIVEYIPPVQVGNHLMITMAHDDAIDQGEDEAALRLRILFEHTYPHFQQLGTRHTARE